MGSTPVPEEAAKLIPRPESCLHDVLGTGGPGGTLAADESETIGGNDQPDAHVAQGKEGGAPVPGGRGEDLEVVHCCVLLLGRLTGVRREGRDRPSGLRAGQSPHRCR